MGRAVLPAIVTGVLLLRVGNREETTELLRETGTSGMGWWPMGSRGGSGLRTG